MAFYRKWLKDTGRMKKDRSQKSQAFCDFISLTQSKGVYHSPHQVQDPRTMELGQIGGQRGKGKWHHMTIVSFLFPSLFARYKLKETTTEKQKGKLCGKANPDGQPASGDCGSLAH